MKIGKLEVSLQLTSQLLIYYPANKSIYFSKGLSVCFTFPLSLDT